MLDKKFGIVFSLIKIFSLHGPQGLCLSGNLMLNPLVSPNMAHISVSKSSWRRGKLPLQAFCDLANLIGIEGIARVACENLLGQDTTAFHCHSSQHHPSLFSQHLQPWDPGKCCKGEMDLNEHQDAVPEHYQTLNRLLSFIWKEQLQWVLICVKQTGMMNFIAIKHYQGPYSFSDVAGRCSHLRALLIFSVCKEDLERATVEGWGQFVVF